MIDEKIITKNDDAYLAVEDEKERKNPIKSALSMISNTHRH